MWPGTASAVAAGHRVHAVSGGSVADFSLEQLDAYWDAIVFAMIGNALRGGTSVTGARVVDKVLCMRACAVLCVCQTCVHACVCVFVCRRV